MAGATRHGVSYTDFVKEHTELWKLWKLKMGQLLKWSSAKGKLNLGFMSFWRERKVFFFCPIYLSLFMGQNFNLFCLAEEQGSVSVWKKIVLKQGSLLLVHLIRLLWHINELVLCCVPTQHESLLVLLQLLLSCGLRQREHCIQICIYPVSWHVFTSGEKAFLIDRQVVVMWVFSFKLQCEDKCLDTENEV